MVDSTSESFSRQLRLTKSTDFQQVFKNNFRRGDSTVTFLVSKKPGSNPRLGFAIARKQIPRAVNRNTLKRTFRESFRRNQCQLPPRDIIIMVRRPILSIDSRQLRVVLDQYWKSIIRQCAAS